MWLVSLVEMQRDEDVLAAIRSTPFGAALSAIDSLNVGQVQRALDRDLARVGVSYFQRAPLSIATAIGYATAKRAETSNVRLIAQRIALGMRQEDIQEDLIVL